MLKTKNFIAAVAIALSCAVGAAPAFADGGPKKPDQQQTQPLKKKPQGQHQAKKKGQPQKGKAQHAGKQQPKKQKPKKQHVSEGMRKGAKMPGFASAPVVDYHKHHLRKPPAGYHWVRHGNDFVLVAIASGIISSIIAATH